MPEPTVKEHLERLAVLNDTAKVTEALRIALRALAWYADEKNWREDDWGVLAVIDHPDYSKGAGHKARNAIKRIDRVTRPERVAPLLREHDDG
jgi:hypothetical protein